MAQGNYAPINGLNMYYETYGTGQPLLLLHGSFGMVGMFGDLIPALAGTRQVIGVELQGHGYTADIDRWKFHENDYRSFGEPLSSHPYKIISKSGAIPMNNDQSNQQNIDLPPELSQPARRALIGAGYLRLEQLNGVSVAEIKRLHGMGPKGIEQLRRALEARGLAFAK